MALCFYKGVGTKADRAKAVELFRQAADHEDKIAQACLAYCLMNGIGKEKNEEEAADWLVESGFDKVLDPNQANQFVKYLNFCFDCLIIATWLAGIQLQLLKTC